MGSYGVWGAREDLGVKKKTGRPEIGFLKLVGFLK
jgi:hypothetical protein